MVFHFSELFEVLNDGRVTPIRNIKLGPATMPAFSAKIPPASVSFGGVKISDLINKNLDIEVVNDIYIIKGYYN